MYITIKYIVYMMLNVYTIYIKSVILFTYSTNSKLN